MKTTIYRPLLFLIFISISSFGQIDPNKLPEMSIPSPQAFEITKYGNTHVDESSGKISPNIPLHNYTVGNISIPISISYSGSGIKVSQNPTWTGVSWNLNAGGVISRIVKDLPDEKNVERILYSEEQLEDLKTNYELLDNNNHLIETGYRLPQNIVNSLKNFENNDSQADEFNFSFGNYSGSFYLLKEGGTWKAKQTKHNTEFKIEIIGNFNLNDNYEFKITTPDGIKYYFGGLAGGLGSTMPFDYAVEETQLIDKSITPFKIGIKSKTAFYLTKVENSIGDYILLEYETIPQYEILSAREQKLFNLISQDITPTQCNQSDGIHNNVNLVTRPIKNTVFNGKFLKKIWSPLKSTSIIFNTITINETILGGIQNFKYKVLTDIILENKRINFSYYPESQNLVSGNVDKFLLTDIIFKDSNNQLHAEKYSFEYKNKEMLPGIFSNSQDYLGYYNGKLNISLLPKNTSFFFSNFLTEFETPQNENQLNTILNLSNFSNFQHLLADRDPDFEYATVGILKKMHYPTGGYTEFEYEPVDKKIIKSGLNLQIYSNMGNSNIVNPAWVPNSKLNALNGISSTFLNVDGSVGENAFENQSVTIDLNINTLLSTGLDYHDYIYVEFKDVNTNRIVEKKYYFPNSVMQFDNTQTNFRTSFNFSLLKDHGYEIRIGFGDQYAGRITNSNTEQFSSTPMYVDVSFDYTKGYDENDGLGIRIKRVKDYKSTNEIADIKRYYYSKIKDINSTDNSLRYFFPVFHNFHMTKVECPVDIDQEIEHPFFKGKYYLTLNSNSFNQNLPSSDMNYLYENVSISYGGDNFENGGIEKQFFIRKDLNQKHYSPNPNSYTNMFYYLLIKFYELDIANRSNEGVINGILLKEDIWKSKNGVLYKIKKNSYQYITDETAGANNINIMKFEDCNYCNEFNISNLYLGLYATNTHKPLLNQKNEIDFIDGEPLSRYIPPANERGWQFLDHDGDGVLNSVDRDYLDFSEDYVESNFKTIVKKVNYDYFLPVMPELPTIITTTKSDNSVESVRNYYPIAQDINALSSELTSEEILAYNILKNNNIISEPIQINIFNNGQLLSKTRITYKILDQFGNSAFKYKVQYAKTNQTLEDRIIYHEYDNRGNPMELSFANGSSTTYIWNFQRKPLYKITNATSSQVIQALSNSNILITENFTGASSNGFINLLPNAQITSYIYDPINNLLSEIIDPKGDKQTYHYDSFNRLQYVKDAQGNIVSENEYNYKN